MTDFYFNPSQSTITGLTQTKADTLYLIKTAGTDNLNSNVNINSGLNINSNLVANSLSITPVELSYLDNLTSNIQTQINNIGGGGSSNIGTITTNNSPIINNDSLNIFASKTNTQLTNLSTINTNNGITSSTNIISTLESLQSQIINLPNGSGAGVSFFLTDVISSVNNQYSVISNIPANSTNQQLTSGIITNTSPNQLMGQFISNVPLNITTIPAGIWDFNMYCSISSNNLSSYLIMEVYKYNGSATLLFTATGSDINSAIIIPYNINLTNPAFNVLTTDYIMLKIYGKTTSANNIVITVDYNSSNNYSHFHIPLTQTQNHNQLLNIQGGVINDYQHLTTAQINNINNPSTTINNGYLLNTDFITFNNKEPAINKLTAFNRDFETLQTNIKINGIQSVGSSLNIARSDHVHPTDNTKENLIIATNTNQFYRGDKVFSNLPISSTTIDGILSAINFNVFNDKEPAISKLTAFNRAFETLSTNIKMNGTQSIGTTLNIARSDHIHPNDDTKENTIIATNTNQFYRGDKVFSNLPISSTTIDGILSAINFNIFNDKPNNITRHGRIYVSKLSGNDSNDGLSLYKAYLTITQALTNTYISSGYQMEIEPSTYNENITISTLNLSITAPNTELGGICALGNITITSNSSSVRLSNLTFNNLTISGNCNVYLINCNINNNILKSGNGYLSINNTICNLTSTITITGSGNCNLMNGSQLGGQFTVNNSSAIVVIMNCQFVANVVLNAGILSIINTVIYATSSSVYAINSTVNSFIYLSNLNCINGNDNSDAKLNFIGYWSTNNVIFNKTTSNLSLLNLQRVSRFDKMDIIDNLSITGNINTTTPTQLSYLDATSSIQTQLNSKISLSTNNIFTGVQSFTKPIKFVIPKTTDSSNTFNIGIGDDVLTLNTIGVGNIGIGISSLPISTTASFNVGLGTNTLQSLTTGNYNIAIGDTAGISNTTASDNIYIGTQSGISNISNQYSNSICLGNYTKSKANNSIVIGSNTQSTYIDGSLTVGGIASLGNNSTAITQAGSDNSTKIATTAFVKLFSAPIVYKSIKILAPYTFTFGPSNQFNFTFQSASGTASNNLYLFISPSDFGTYNLTVNSTLIYGVTNGTVYNITSTTTVNNASAYLQIGTGLLLGSADSRGCKGDIYDWATNIYFRFSIMVKNSVNLLYVIEQI